jgi:hypothetical protein
MSIGLKMNLCDPGRIKVIRVVMKRDKGDNSSERYEVYIVLCGRKG